MSLETANITLRRMRNKIFNYTGEKEIQADRVLAYLKVRMLRERKKLEHKEPTGQWSGLTRAELNRSGTCETDWY